MARKEWEPPPGQPISRPRKRAWLTPTYRCPSEKRNILPRNQTRSPLLSLPPEIRNRIYEHVFGNQVIHIATRDCPWDEQGAWLYSRYYRYKGWSRYKYLRFSQVVCCRGLAGERSADRLSKKPESVSDAKVQSYDRRQRRCFHVLSELKHSWYRDDSLHMHAPLSSDLALRRKYGVALNLSLLLACRQIHPEAALIPYATNTFAFRDGLDLDLFVSESLLAPQRKAIQRLQLDGYLNGYQGSFPGILGPTANLLTGLTHLSLAVSAYRRGGDVYNFRKIPLKKVEIIVGSDDCSGKRMEKRKRAKMIEHILNQGQRRQHQ